MAEKSYGELVLERIAQLDKEFLESQRKIEITTDEGTGRLRPEDYESYRIMMLGDPNDPSKPGLYPAKWLQMPDGTITFESPAIVLLRDYPERILNHGDVWPDIKKALGVE